MSKAMYKDLMPSKHDGYYVVPNLPEIAVSKEGKFVVEKTGKPVAISQKENPYRYPFISVGEKTFLVHRVIAETFLKKPTEQSIVNHKDGVKYHNQLENLEWVDYSENILHAYRTGLRTDNHPVLVKDLRTGEIKRFYSISECARFFNTSAAVIYHQLRFDNFGKVYSDYFVLIREGQKWPPLGPEAIGIYRNGTAKPVFIYSEEENKLILFRSGWEASEYLNVSGAAISKWLRNAGSSVERVHRHKHWVIGLWQEHKDRFIGMTSPENIPKKNWARTPRKPSRIRVTNLETGEVREMASLKTLADEFGVKKSAIQKYIWKTNGTWQNRFRVEYLQRNKHS